MISANVISGPFYEAFAEASFQSILDLVDEIVVVDTAPGNNPNHEINKKYATKLIPMERKSEAEFSFTEARELARINSSHEWILKWDQDEVLHEKDIEKILSTVNDTKFSGIELAYYHFMMYPWLYQFIDTKRYLFKKELAAWDGTNVHEGVSVRGEFENLHDIKVFHYGYIRGPEEVFKRWYLYAQIVGKEHVYDNVNPKTILHDRINTCLNFEGEHPKYVKDVLEQMFRDVTPFQ